jgi:hypothetical protein
VLNRYENRYSRAVSITDCWLLHMPIRVTVRQTHWEEGGQHWSPVS